MGAVAPVTPWIPKDDLLLKTSIEGGASLESLARGAVQFSRRFTIKELQDRWHTLLYDPIISAEASASIIEYERSFRTNKADSSKEAKCGQRKRKAESIRRCYYAMRKRICNESLDQSDLSFLVAADNSCFITGVEGPGPQSIHGDPMPTRYGVEGANLHHVFPGVTSDSAPPCGVASGQQNMLKDPIKQQNAHKEVAQMTGSNNVTAQTFPEEPTGNGIFHKNGLGSNSVYDDKGILRSGFRDINSSISECETSLHHLQYASSPPEMPDWKSNESILVPGDGDTVNRASGYNIRAESELNNHVSCAEVKGSTDCKEGYLAELSDSLFNFASDDEMLIDGGKDVIDKTYLGLSTLLLNSPGVRKEEIMPDKPELEEPAGVVDNHGGNGVPPIASLEEKIEAGEILLENSCDGNEETRPDKPELECLEKKNEAGEIHLESAGVDDNHGGGGVPPIERVEKKNEAGEIHLEHSLDRNEKTMPDKPELEKPAGVDDDHNVPPVVSPEEKNGPDEIHLEHSCDSNLINSESQIPTSASTVYPKHPEIHDGFILCTLNTEAPDIPCNDGIILPNKTRPQSAVRRTQSEANNLSISGKDSSGSQTTMAREAKRSRDSRSAFHTTDLDATLNQSVGDFRVKFEAGESHNSLRNLSAIQEGLCQSSLIVKKEYSEFPLIRLPTSDVLEKSGQVAAPSCVQTGFAGINQEGQTTLSAQNQELYALESAEPLAIEPGGEPLLSEDEKVLESDTDMPFFSDIESMILDMDLVSEDQDSFYAMEVAKYKHEGAQREIIRLEQNALSYMQRAMASHGAFAIMYGRHSKHYIKKPEVLLGRGTHDVPVDIDLNSEGRANKISRRQAIIRMEKDGTFILRNTGKHSIYVNSKEVSPGLALGLQSNSLIEIREMMFIFETHPALVKKYLGGAAQRSTPKLLNVK